MNICIQLPKNKAKLQSKQASGCRYIAGVSNIFYFHPYLGKMSNLTNIFQMGGSTTNKIVTIPKKRANLTPIFWICDVFPHFFLRFKLFSQGRDLSGALADVGGGCRHRVFCQPEHLKNPDGWKISKVSLMKEAPSCLFVCLSVLSCLVLSCLVLSCLVLFCFVLFCFVLFVCLFVLRYMHCTHTTAHSNDTVKHTHCLAQAGLKDLAQVTDKKAD